MTINFFEFRVEKHYLREDVRQSKVAIAIVMFFLGVLAVGDYWNFGLGFPFFMTVSVRFGFGVVSLLVYKKLRAVDDAARHRRLMLAWGTAFAALILFVNIVRPPDNINFSYIDTLIVLAIYLAFPNRLPLKAVLAGIITAGDLGHPTDLNTAHLDLGTGLHHQTGPFREECHRHIGME